MNDRFRFRAWDKSFNKYCENVIVSTINEKITVYGRLVNGRTQLIPNSHVVLEQCTGLKDKNGKLVYESDIITDGIENYVVVWIDDDDHLGFYVRDLDNVHCTFYQLLEYTIIGNIHENPELLEDK